MDALRWTLARLDWSSILDIALVTLVFFWFLVLIYQTRADQVFRGVVLLIIVSAGIAATLQLSVLEWLVLHSVPVLLIAIPVVFQPELRKLLEQLGRTSLIIHHPLSRLTQPVSDHTINQLIMACERLAQQSFGALIIIERQTGLQDYANRGVLLDAPISVDLLQSIFFKNSALHDGAVIIRGDKVLAAKCVLPLSENIHSLAHTGTRHNAAVGITEITDATALIVSEETGTISLAIAGILQHNLSKERLREALQSLDASQTTAYRLVQDPARKIS